MATVTLPILDSSSEQEIPAPNCENHFHLGLSVADVDKAVAFYQVIFDGKPFKHYPDYAEFVSEDPALVLTLTKYPRTPGGPINHIGLRFGSKSRLEAVHARLEAAGLAPKAQGSVNCCYAKGTKVWAVDPDHNLLELYVLEEDLAQFGYEEPPALPEEPKGEVWEHRAPAELPERIEHADDSLDEVTLVGALNAGHTPDRLASFLAEVRRVLKPGGRVKVQGMVGDVPFPGVPKFPGLASRIQTVPVEREPVECLQAAGFKDIFFEQHGDIKCLQAEGVQLRKVRISAAKPRGNTVSQGGSYSVRYLGPFTEIEIDEKLTLRRGVTTPVTVGVWQDLKTGPSARQFAFFTDEPSQ